MCKVINEEIIMNQSSNESAAINVGGANIETVVINIGELCSYLYALETKVNIYSNLKDKKSIVTTRELQILFYPSLKRSCLFIGATKIMQRRRNYKGIKLK